MSYPKTRQNFVEFKQTRSTNPANEYGEEYQYEEYVHKGTGQPGSYKREVRYVRGGPNQEEFYEDRIIPLKDRKTKNPQVTKQVVTTVKKTTESKNVRNQPKIVQREYISKNYLVENNEYFHENTENYFMDKLKINDL